MPRLMELHRQAAKCGLVNGSDHERLMFVAAAERARMLPPDVKNPCGVFVRIIKGKLWKQGYISEGQIEAANSRLREYLFGPSRSERGGGFSSMATGVGQSVGAALGSGQAQQPRKSKDAVLLETIRNRARLRDLEVVFPVLRGEYGWDRARFVKARERKSKGPRCEAGPRSGVKNRAR